MTSHRFLDGRHAPSNKRRLQSFTSRCVPPTEYPSSTPGSSLQQQTEAVAQVKVNTQCSHRYQQRRKMTTWIMGPKQKKENARNIKFNNLRTAASLPLSRVFARRRPVCRGDAMGSQSWHWIESCSFRALRSLNIVKRTRADGCGGSGAGRWTEKTQARFID